MVAETDQGGLAMGYQPPGPVEQEAWLVLFSLKRRDLDRRGR